MVESNKTLLEPEPKTDSKQVGVSSTEISI